MTIQFTVGQSITKSPTIMQLPYLRVVSAFDPFLKYHLSKQRFNYHIQILQEPSFSLPH